MNDRELLELLLSKVTSMESDIKDIKIGLKSVNEQTTILTEFREETNTNFNNLEDKLTDLEGTNASNHVAINSRLNKVSDDLDFLTHKEFQTEKEMYHIKQKLIRQKRIIK